MIQMTHVETFVDIEVSIHIPFMSSPNRASHAGPWFLDGQNAFHIVPMNLLARHRIHDGRLDPEEWEGGAARFGGSDTAKRADYMRPRFSLPVSLKMPPAISGHTRSRAGVTYIHDVRFFSADDLKVPLPHLSRNRLTHRAQDS